jgi:SPASM domain peptide maturase of grasp-with-spasm system
MHLHFIKQFQDSKSSELYINLFQTCLLTKGYNQSTILDYQRKRIFPIPNSMFEFITEVIVKNSIHTIIQKYNDYLPTINDYFEFLITNDICFVSSKSERALFKDLSVKFDFPSEISNGILEYNSNSKYSLEETIIKLDLIGCHYLELRYFATDNENLHSALEHIEESSIRKLHLYTNSINESALDNVIKVSKKLDFIYLFESAQNDDKLINGVRIFNTIKSYNSNLCGCIDKKYFSFEVSHFTESLKNNTCLNKKISIDAEGKIKNCPSIEKHYGLVETISLEKILLNNEFRSYWNIHKDEIKTCQDCEFRNICTDCRAYIENPEDLYSKPLKCGYNPYTNEWEEWSKNPLKEKGIQFYGMGFKS